MAALVTRQRTWSDLRKNRPNRSTSATTKVLRPLDPAMPTLFRFLVVVAIICGVAYAVVFALANFVTYKPREIVVTVPSDHFVKPKN
jgi:predicted PurR-regulated permease PerM